MFLTSVAILVLWILFGVMFVKNPVWTLTGSKRVRHPIERFALGIITLPFMGLLLELASRLMGSLGKLMTLPLAALLDYLMK